MTVMTTSNVCVDNHDSTDKANLDGAVFTPEQYAEILRLLSKDTYQSSKDGSVVNMAGNHLSHSQTLNITLDH